MIERQCFGCHQVNFSKEENKAALRLCGVQKLVSAHRFVNGFLRGTLNLGVDQFKELRQKGLSVRCILNLGEIGKKSGNAPDPLWCKPKWHHRWGAESCVLAP